MIFPGEKRTRDSLLPAALVPCLVAVAILYYNSQFMFREQQGVPADQMRILLRLGGSFEFRARRRFCSSGESYIQF